MLMRSLILKGAGLAPVRRFVGRGKLFEPLVHRFVAGDTLDSAMKAAGAVLAKGQLVSLDYLGENTQNEQEALAAKNTYITMLERIASNPANRKASPSAYACGEIENLNISIKLTQCGLDQGTEFAFQNYSEVLDAAAQLGNFVRVDMESSEYTERTLLLLDRALKTHPNTGTVLQSYLKRTDEDIDWVIRAKARVRLVKGAYLEHPEVAFTDKAMVDQQYVKQAKRLLQEAVYPAIATQDERIVQELLAFAKEQKIEKRSFEFQMLYGIRRDLQDQLVTDGYNVRVYIPFGDAWYPYFTRRLAERPANALFILKNLTRG